MTINLWGDLQADIKIPVLMLIMFLLGFLPAWLFYRARHWRLAAQAPRCRGAAASRRESDEEPAE